MRASQLNSNENQF